MRVNGKKTLAIREPETLTASISLGERQIPRLLTERLYDLPQHIRRTCRRPARKLGTAGACSTHATAVPLAYCANPRDLATGKKLVIC